MPKEPNVKAPAADRTRELAERMRLIKERARKRDQRGHTAEGKFVSLKGPERP